MAVAIKLTFPAGRYHATPWGRHVNEGVPEWPPSPWRILRAFIAVWKRTCSDLPESQVKRILEQLVHPPNFKLPNFRVAHTRHYMPWEKKGPADRTLVFDTFVSLDRNDELLVGWPEAELSAEDRSALATLVGNLTSLGRAEAWVHAEIVEGSADWNCVPTDSDPNPVPLFCPDPAGAFGDEHYPTLDPKKLAKGKVNPSEYLFDCPRWHLCLDTETIHENRWPTVPGGRWVNYQRPAERLAAAPKRKASESRKPTVARFLLDGPVLPLLTDTVRVAESFRIAAMSRFKGWCLKHPELASAFQRLDKPDAYSSPVLAGKDLGGVMLADHGHAFYLPTVEGDDPRRITHVTVIARDGFGLGETAALTSMRFLKGSEESDELRVQLVGLGQPNDFNHRLFQSATVWKSITPFLGPAHIGQHSQERYMRKAIRKDCRRFVERGGLTTTLVDLEIVPRDQCSVPALQFRRQRQRRTQRDGYRPGAFVRLTFDRAVSGPLCLGYASHFGLGLFAPET